MIDIAQSLDVISVYVATAFYLCVTVPLLVYAWRENLADKEEYKTCKDLGISLLIVVARARKGRAGYILKMAFCRVAIGLISTTAILIHPPNPDMVVFSMALRIVFIYDAWALLQAKKADVDLRKTFHEQLVDEEQRGAAPGVRPSRPPGGAAPQ